MPADIIAFSHLRWDSNYQRPHHILQRMAKSRRVYYIEEPVFTGTYKVHCELTRPAPGVTVCRPQIPSRGPGYGGRNVAPLRNLLGDLIEMESIRTWVAWFFSPSALPVIGHRTPSGIVYDCVGQRSADKEYAEELLNVADLVLRSSSLSQASWDQTVAVIEGLLGEVEAEAELDHGGGSAADAILQVEAAPSWIVATSNSRLP